MIRVLHVVSTVGVGSGVMSFIMNYYRNINRENVQFDLLCWVKSDDVYVDEIKRLGGNVFYIPKPGISKEYWKEIIEFFKNNSSRYKILHLHEVYLNMFIPPIARKYGIKHIIAHSHAQMYSIKKLNSLRNKVLCFPIKINVNNYFACSKAAGEFLFGKKCIEQGNVKIINNAIDCDKYQFNNDTRAETRRKLDIDSMFVMGHIGRFSDEKNHMFLIDIFIEVLKHKPNSMLMLIGTGPLQEKIARKIKLKKIDDKVLLFNERNDIPDLLQAMDVFVLPSLAEGLGIVLIEAQISGLQCVASDVVPTEARVTNNLSYLSLKLSAEDWAKCVIERYNHSKRVDQTNIVKNSGFNIKTEAEKLERIYLDICMEEL